MSVLKIKRGITAEVPSLLEGEPFLDLTKEVVLMGSSDGNVAIGPPVKSLNIKKVDIKIFLHGGYDDSIHMMHTLLADSFADHNDFPYKLPEEQTYTHFPMYYGGQEKLSKIIPNAVDWIYVELLDENFNVSSKRAGILLSNGKIVDVDGTSPLEFEGADLNNGNYYIYVKHRNHFGITSANAISMNNKDTVSYDFTTAMNKAYGGDSGTPLYETESGVFAAPPGDIEGLNFMGHDVLDPSLDKTVWQATNGQLGYYYGDLNLTGDVTASDNVIYYRSFKKQKGYSPKSSSIIYSIKGTSTTDSFTKVKPYVTLLEYGTWGTIRKESEYIFAFAPVNIGDTMIADIVLYGIAEAGTALLAVSKFTISVKRVSDDLTAEGDALEMAYTDPAASPNIIPANWDITVSKQYEHININAHGESGQEVDWYGTAKVSYYLA